MSLTREECRVVPISRLL